MGLDLVEIVLESEEVFGISIPDDLAEQIRTVGDLYGTVCTQLRLPMPTTAPTKSGHSFLHSRLSSLPSASPLTYEDIWATIVALIAEQLQVENQEIRYDASFQNHLGCD